MRQSCLQHLQGLAALQCLLERGYPHFLQCWLAGSRHTFLGARASKSLGLPAPPAHASGLIRLYRVSVQAQSHGRVWAPNPPMLVPRRARCLIDTQPWLPDGGLPLLGMSGCGNLTLPCGCGPGASSTRSRGSDVDYRVLGCQGVGT